MSFRQDHEIYRRRLSRNIGLGVTLIAFVGLVFALTVVKVTSGDPMQAFDHVVRPEMAPETLAPVAAPLTAAPAAAAPVAPSANAAPEEAVQ